MADSNITKNALASAMKELMATEPFAKISVSDICDKCYMNRKSFYYHFRDKYDLVNWIFYTEFLGLVRVDPQANSWAIIEGMCAYFYQNRAFYVNALKVTGQDSFREYFAVLMKPILTAYYNEVFEDSEHREFFAVFYTDAFLLAIERWLNEEKYTAEEFVERLRLTVTNTAKKLVKDMEAENG